MKEKAINAANDTNTDADRAIIQKELNQLEEALNNLNEERITLEGSQNGRQ